MTTPRPKSTKARALVIGAGAFALLMAAFFVIQGSHASSVYELQSKGSYWTDFMLLLAVGLMVWLHSVWHRCPDHLIKRDISGITVFLIFWMLDVAIKYEATNNLLISFLWYYFYVPICLGPALMLECALHAAALDNKKAVRTAVKAVKGLSVACIALVFTNNLHHLVFIFSFADPDWSSAYSYGPGYVLVIAWTLLMLAAFIATLYYAAHKTARSMVFRLMGLLFVVLIYGALYILRVLPSVLGNLSLTYSLLMVLTVELCLRGGLLPSYSDYAQAFAHLPFDVRILSRSGEEGGHTQQREALSTCELTEHLPKDQAGQLLLEPTSIIWEDQHLTTTSAPIPAGLVVAVENVASLNQQRSDLHARQKELSARNQALTHDYAVRSELLQLSAETALYAEIEQALSHSVARIQALLDTLPGAESPDQTLERQQSLFQIKLLLSYCKRQGGLILMSKDNPLFDEERLSLALNETVSDLRTSGVECGVFTVAPRVLSAATASAFYDCVYNCGALALLLDRPEMMIFLKCPLDRPAELRLILESPSLAELSADMLQDLQTELEAVAAECKITEEDGALHLVATEIAGSAFESLSLQTVADSASEGAIQ